MFYTLHAAAGSSVERPCGNEKPEDFIKDTDEDDKTDAEDLDAKMDVMSLLERFREE